MNDNNIFSDWISLILTNVNPSAPSTVNIFQIPNNSSVESTLSGQGIFNLPATDFPNTFIVTLEKSGNVSPFPIIATDIDDLINQAQALLNADGGGKVFYTGPISGDYTIYFYSPLYTLVSVATGTTYTAVQLNQNIITDTTIDVETASTSLTYGELCQELSFQPYKLRSVNVYAATLDQANTQFVLSDQNDNGLLDQRPNIPSLSPISKQFVNLNIPLNYTPTPTNTLQYTIAAGERVQLIFKYINQDLLKIPSKTIFVPKKEIIGIEKEFEKQKIHVPLIAVVDIFITTPVLKLKKALQKYVEPNKVNPKEVFSAFDGIDFKELD